MNKEDYSLFDQLHPNTEICVNLKIYSQNPARMQPLDMLRGTLVRDTVEDHFVFREDTPRTMPVERNPIVLRCRCFNLHKAKDGYLYPVFRRPAYSAVFSFADFCRQAAEELNMVSTLKGEEVLS